MTDTITVLEHEVKMDKENLETLLAYSKKNDPTGNTLNNTAFTRSGIACVDEVIQVSQFHSVTTYILTSYGEQIIRSVK